MITAVMVVYTMVTGVMEGRDLSWIEFPSLFLGVTAVMVVQVMVTAMMEGRDHL